MQITYIDTIEQMDQLKSDWDAVHAADPHANIFVSWAWVRGFFEISHYDWFVLAFRPNDKSSHVAFFPLAIEQFKFNLLRVLRMGGAPLADYTGFVCLPEYEQIAVKAFADYVQHQLTWDRFHVKDVLDSRVDGFLESFADKKFELQEIEQMPCPYIPLPDSWDDYLMNCLSRTSRKRVRQRTRQNEELEDFRITHAQEDNIDDFIETLLSLWKERWGPKYFEINVYRHLYKHCFKHNCLWLAISWTGTEPVAALAGYLDQPKNTFYSVMSAYDDKYSKISPGRVLDAHSIQYAIENGFKTYDYLRGASDYKFSLGAVERYIPYVLVARTNVRSRAANIATDIAKRLTRSFRYS